MRDRFWYELTQAKHNEIYTTLLIGHFRYWSKIVNVVIVVFSTAGVMGWGFWEKAPIVACVIIASISLLKLIFPYFVPSEEQMEKFYKTADFYSDFYLKLESIWFDFENDRISEVQMQKEFYELKQTEREISTLTNKIHSKPVKSITNKTAKETDNFFKLNFNTFHHE